MRLLFVEDEPDLREVLKKQLQGSGYSVDACGEAVLPVEAVLALHDTGVRAVAEALRRLTQRECHVEVCHGGVLNGRVLQRGVLVADRAGGDDHVAGLHIDVDAAAGAGADEGIRAELMHFHQSVNFVFPTN